MGKPRTRILLGGLRSGNVVVAQCLVDLWRGVEDKSQIRGARSLARFAFNYLFAYPVLIWRYLRAPRHDAVFVAYMGHLDVLVLWPFAKMRGAKIIWDAFLSLYDTVVEDRGLIAKGSVRARIISVFERLACAAADTIVLDTEEHAKFFQKRYGLAPQKLISVWVGAETEVFKQRADMPCADKERAQAHKKFSVLFYGQLIPLHGVEHIIEAIEATPDPDIEWTIIGRGQETAKIKSLVAGKNLTTLKMIDWVDYKSLPAYINEADLCLGVFGTSEKAARVIPNKIFQIIACGRPFVTIDSPAIREIVSPHHAGVWLVEAGSGAAIAEAVAAAKRDEGGAVLYPGLREKISPQAIGGALMNGLRRRECKAAINAISIH